MYFRLLEGRIYLNLRSLGKVSLKKSKKKLEISNFRYFTPLPPESWKKSYGTPPFSPTPLRNGKNFFAFLDVLDHLEAKKNEKKKCWKMTLLRPSTPPSKLEISNTFFDFFLRPSL